MTQCISISQGNSKTGSIRAFSLPPVKACPNNKTCASFVAENGKEYNCYAVNSYNQWPETEKAWDRNFAIAQNDLQDLENQLMAYFKGKRIKIFRIHVSGDFYSQEYTDMWVRVVAAYPKINFLAYTKVYGYFLKHKGKLPENFSVLLSFMPSVPMSAAQKLSEIVGLPIAYASSDSHKGFITCPEQSTDSKVNCKTCQLCWNLPRLKRPMNIRFIPH